MSNYQEQDVTGITWKRARQIVVDNPYNEVPRVSFIEEIHTELSNGMQRNEIAPGTMNVPYQPGYSFPLLNPADNTPLGADGSADQLMVLIYSLYMHEAAKRDANQAP